MPIKITNDKIMDFERKLQYLYCDTKTINFCILYSSVYNIVSSGKIDIAINIYKKNISIILSTYKNIKMAKLWIVALNDIFLFLFNRCSLIKFTIDDLNNYHNRLYKLKTYAYYDIKILTNS
jgi:hypothetical protein